MVVAACPDLLFRHAHIMYMGQVRFWVGGDSNNAAQTRSELPPQMQVDLSIKRIEFCSRQGEVAIQEPWDAGSANFQFSTDGRRLHSFHCRSKMAFWLSTGGLGTAMCAPVKGVHL